MQEIHSKPLPAHLDSKQQLPRYEHILAGKIRFKSRKIDEIESENREILRRIQDA
jgi:hypothetical protein